MRFFETYPPSSVLLALALGVALAIGGLSFAVPLVAGALAAWLGFALDHYGTRR